MEQPTGFEPALSVWKTEVLPLHHGCIRIPKANFLTLGVLFSCSGYPKRIALPLLAVPPEETFLMRDYRSPGSSL